MYDIANNGFIGIWCNPMTTFLADYDCEINIREILYLISL